LVGSDVGNDEILAAFTIIYMLSSDKHINELPYFELGQNSCRVSDRFSEEVGLTELVSIPYWG